MKATTNQRPRWQVMTRIYQQFGTRWENTWREEDEDGNMVPQTFETKREAEEELRDFLKDMMLPEEYNRINYRVFKVL